ncbi:MAG: UDP-N-acetylglucosamine--N-acetylmuramyl-(pentapeptide) pyrophosphoryl-undecaprenol N-acetylglucosamine transferase [Bdellovibrionales bacterium]|nr:UDP-N-acetylglucosamine--N-acetylmuramyl-(pentapeptide) pyrophosphoryl-undecaprenol N-acetylglucosamine transferase [Bdellovibrionales bacterium]
MSKDKKFLMTAGSTGGHIFPILAVAEELKIQGHDIHIVSSGSELEKTALFEFPVSVLSIGRLRKNIALFERVKTFILLPYYLIRALFILLKVKPDKVIGSGGAVSGPILLMACFLRYETVIWELNAVPGFANKILSFFVKNIFIGFASTEKYFSGKKCQLTSFPVRKEIRETGSQEREADGYSHLLILGGSQGSHAINKAVMDMYGEEKMETWKIRHQTGLRDFNSIHSMYKDRIECSPFYKDMGSCYRWADVIVARAGAVTLAELSACGKASIVIPLSSASDDHQLKNAQALYQGGAIEMILEEDLSGARLFEMIMSIHGKKKRELETHIKKFYDPQGLQKIIHYCQS